MNEGFWLRSRDGKVFPIIDHAGDFYNDSQLAKKMGLLPLQKELIKKGIKPEGAEGKNRTKVVLEIMKNGYIRARGHGAYVTFEFTDYPSEVLDAIYDFGKDEFGAFTNLNIVHLNEKGKAIDSAQMNWQQFKEAYEEGDKQKLLRTAGFKFSSLMDRKGQK